MSTGKNPPKAIFDKLTPDEINQFSADYRSGIKSDRQIAAEWGITHTTVRRWARALGISRDLVLAIQQRTKAKLAHKAAKDAAAEQQEPHRLDRPTERAVVEANADLCATVITTHRQDIARARKVLESLLGELEQDSMLTAEEVESIAAANGEASEVQQAAFRRAIGRGARVSDIKALIEALSRVTAMEREAYNLGEDGTPRGGAGAGQASTMTDVQRASRLAALIAKAQARKQSGEGDDAD